MSRLSEYLHEQGITPEEFGRKIGAASKATVYRYMNGERRPNAAMMIKILEATDGVVTPNDFFIQLQPAAEGGNSEDE